MKAGELKDKIMLLKLAEPLDPDGVPGKTYQVYKTVWGDFLTLSVKEYFEYRTKNTFTSKVVIRYRSDVDESMKIRFEGEDYEIESVINHKNESRKLIILLTKER